LLHASRNAPPTLALRAAVAGRFELVVSGEQLTELVDAIQTKPYLASHIDRSSTEELIALLSDIADIVPEITDVIPPITRDPGDDYLLAHAAQDRIDVLVSGDKDLLVLGRIGNVRIVSPAEFLFLLDLDEE
jgi:uncharacterized protein